MNIILLISNLKNKGPSNQTLLLASELKAQGFKVELVLVKMEISPRFKEVLDKYDIVPTKLTLSRLLYMRKASNVVHSTGLLPDLLLAMACARNWVITIRNIPNEDYVTKFRFGKFFATIHQLIFKRASIVVACSPYIKNGLKKIGQNSWVVNNSGPRNSNINVNNQEGDGLKWIAVGSFLQRKNHEILLKIFSKNVALGSLTVLGDGELYQPLNEKYSQYDNIDLIGATDSPHEIIAKHSIFLSASVSEGLPNAVLEALALKLPCVLSDIEPHMFIQSYHPKSVLCINFEDTKLATQLLFNAKDNYEKKLFRCTGLNPELSVENMCKEYVNLYQKLIR